MKKQERVEKRRQVRAQQKRKKELRDELEVLESEVDDEIDLAHIDDDEDEPVEQDVPEQKEKELFNKQDLATKAYDSEMPVPMMAPMPTSWEEKDALDQAREQAHELREIGWDVQDLVYNILCHPEMTPSAKAQAIQDVGSGFEDRVSEIMDGGEEDTSKELDLLSIEAIQAYDRGHTGILENISDLVEKAKLTAKRENALSDEQFALVRDEGGKKVRKYPIHDKAHVRNALARAAQMIARGGPAAKDAKAALPKIHAAAKRMGIGTSMKKENNSLMIEKDAKGDWRWVGWTSNNFIDSDGDIFSEDAHKEYVEWLDKNMDVAPAFVSWHTPGTVREFPVDFASCEKGFMIMSGKLTEQEAAGLLKAKSETEIGMSHGTFIFGRDPKDPRIVTKYRMYEVSDLPLDRAANPFTAFETITIKEVDMDKQKYLATILGSEEKAKAFLERTGMKQKELQEAGVESKEKVETPVVVNNVAPAETPDVAAIAKELGLDDLSAWVEKASEALEKLPLLEAAVKELSQSKEEKVAEMIAPPASARFAWVNSAKEKQDQKNVVDKNDPITKETPGVPAGYWLSDATGTTPENVIN